MNDADDETQGWVPEETAPPTRPEPTAEVAALDYESMTKADLQALGDERGLDLSGMTKSDMIAALGG